MKIIEVIEALIDTVERTTDLEGVYNEKNKTCVSWEDVDECRLFLNRFAFSDQVVSHLASDFQEVTWLLESYSDDLEYNLSGGIDNCEFVTSGTPSFSDEEEAEEYMQSLKRTCDDMRKLSAVLLNKWENTNPS